VDVSAYLGHWDRSLLPSNVHVGQGCYLEGAHSFDRFSSKRDPGLIIGSNVAIYTWTAFNVESSGFISIGDRSLIVGGLFMCADQIVVGADVVISYHVTVADSDFHPLDVKERRRDAIANAPGGDLASRPHFESRPVVIEDGAWIGIGAMILKGVTVGANARIGPGAVVTRDIPARTTWEGNPARLAEPR